MRIAIGGICHETSTFANTRTRVADFESGFGLFRGADIVERFRGANTCTGASLKEPTSKGSSSCRSCGALRIPAG